MEKQGTRTFIPTSSYHDFNKNDKEKLQEMLFQLKKNKGFKTQCFQNTMFFLFFLTLYCSLGKINIRTRVKCAGHFKNDVTQPTWGRGSGSCDRC